MSKPDSIGITYYPTGSSNPRQLGKSHLDPAPGIQSSGFPVQSFLGSWKARGCAVSPRELGPS